MNLRSLTFHSISLLLVMAPCSYTSFRRAETDACAVRRSLVAPSVMKGEIIIRPDYQRKSTAKYVLSPGNDRNSTAMSQYTPFSPTVAPPPAHQSPRHVQYTTHPLPAHVHPVLQSSTLPTGPYPTQIASQYGSLNPAGGIYATYPLSPTKGRSYQYFA